LHESCEQDFQLVPLVVVHVDESDRDDEVGAIDRRLDAKDLPGEPNYTVHGFGHEAEIHGFSGTCRQVSDQKRPGAADILDVARKRALLDVKLGLDREPEPIAGPRAAVRGPEHSLSPTGTGWVAVPWDINVRIVYDRGHDGP
jgi:hypothetical protein